MDHGTNEDQLAEQSRRQRLRIRGTVFELVVQTTQVPQTRAKVARCADVGISAKDILRASRTPMSEVAAFDWGRQQQQIRDGEALGPILIVRQNDGASLIVADGFHRMCALFAEDELIKVPCKIV